MNNELKELEDEADKLAQQIQWNEEWIRLSIVEKTALMAAYAASSMTGNALDSARYLFFEIKKNNEWCRRDCKNNHQPYQTELEKRIKALKKALRTPEEVAEAEEAEKRRIARLEMYRV